MTLWLIKLTDTFVRNLQRKLSLGRDIGRLINGFPVNSERVLETTRISMLQSNRTSDGGFILYHSIKAKELIGVVGCLENILPGID